MNYPPLQGFWKKSELPPSPGFQPSALNVLSFSCHIKTKYKGVLLYHKNIFSRDLCQEQLIKDIQGPNLKRPNLTSIADTEITEICSAAKCCSLKVRQLGGLSLFSASHGKLLALWQRGKEMDSPASEKTHFSFLDKIVLQQMFYVLMSFIWNCF